MNITIYILSALAEPSRLQALEKIWQGGEHCVCEIMETMGKSQSTASRHMAVLKKAGLVSDRRDAQWVRYCKNPKLSKQTVKLVEQVIQHARKVG